MKKILVILLILVCIFGLCSLTLGHTIDGFFTGIDDQSPADEYGQFLDSFGVILDWFNGIGNFFKATLKFIRDFGIAVANAWEALEIKLGEIGTAIVETFENILEFFGWVNTEKPVPETPPSTEYSALRSRSKEVLGASLTEWSLALITTPQGFSTRGKDNFLCCLK